jgi:hypothetical protein
MKDGSIAFSNRGPSGVAVHRRARLFFHDVGSWRVADWGMGSTSDGRRGYSLSAPRPKPSGPIGPPATVMLLRAGHPGVGGRRR